MPIIIAGIAIVLLLNLSGGLVQGQGPSDDVDIFVVEEIPSDKTKTTKNTNTISENKTSKTQKVKEEPILDLRTPTIDTLSAQDIEASKASLRGNVNMYSHKNGLVFAVYGYSAKEVSGYLNQYQKYSEIPKPLNDKARVVILDSKAQVGVDDYRRSVSGLISNTTYYYKLCVEHDDLSLNNRKITCGVMKSFVTNPSSYSVNDFSRPRVGINSATYIGAYEATLSGNVQMKDGVDGIVFFAYGENESLVKGVENATKYTSIREFDEDLQKVRLGAAVRGKADYKYVIEDLDNGTKYFYRLCAEYDGERSGLVCTSLRNFTTDSRDKSSLPFVRTEVATLTGLSEVRLRGLVSMNDFNDGIAFFVIGTNEAKIKEAVKRDSFSGIRQSGDQLQKLLVDSDADGNNNYSKTIADLKANTHYFYSVCVEYENENEKNRLDTFLACGSVKSLITN